MIEEKSASNPFKSFWMAGFECTDQLNAFGNRVDFLTITDHIAQINSDYELLKTVNMHTVREGIRWSKVEKSPYQYDFSSVREMIQSGIDNGIQQIWDICHFGYPDDITPLHPLFSRRFASLCRAFVQFYRTIIPTGELIVTPINEVSFISWLGGDVRGTAPYCNHNGWEVKYGLMKAYIEGIVAMMEEDSSIRILTTEPLINIVSRYNATEQDIIEAEQAHENQFQTLDILSGKMCPELGGKPEYIDMIGVNYYYENQWAWDSWEILLWYNEDSDTRFRPLNHLLSEVYERYGKPIIITETSHPKEDRPKWMDHIAVECCKAISQNIPLWGVCIYPIIDRPDWDHLYDWHQAGMWDNNFPLTGIHSRNLCQPYADALREAQKDVAIAINAKQLFFNPITIDAVY